MKFIRTISYPFALLYGLIMALRNFLYKIKFFPSKSFEIPVISVGNLCVGGTGKTPHIEYLVSLLKSKFETATLSRGYGRKTKGFVLASKTSTAEEIGDEPCQLKRKFNNIQVAVCESRVKGTKELLKQFEDLEVLLLDDAFQHRAIKPGFSILLTDYYDPYTRDYMLPFGNLREFRAGSKRADIIIVTKTPKIFSPISARQVLDELKPKNFQKVYFSYLKYSNLKPFSTTKGFPDDKQIQTIVLVTGIANPYPLKDRLVRTSIKLEHIVFPDHHEYSVKDVMMIKEKFNTIVKANKIIITTEKDSMRLDRPEFKDLLKGLPFYYIKVEIDFHNNEKENFNKQIISYVKQNKRNHAVHPKQSKPKA